MARPCFEPTPAKRRLVKILASCGTTQEEIAEAVGLESPMTLRKYFRKELDLGVERANARVLETLVKMATSGRCPAATFFFLKIGPDWCENAPSPPREQDRETRVTYVEARNGRPYYPELGEEANWASSIECLIEESKGEGAKYGKTDEEWAAKMRELYARKP